MLDEDLTAAERLRLVRQRKRLSVAAAAAALGVSEIAYRAWEAGDGGAPIIPLPFGMDLGARYFILRLRAGYTVARVAIDLGIPPSAVYAMESGKLPCTLLAWYWRDV